MAEIDFWEKPRRVSVVVDNDSWILPTAERLVDWINAQGDRAALCRSHEEIAEGAAAFYLGCVKITPPAVLARNRRNLVVHASDLPRGRGFSPWTWQILEGKADIPVCLLEAVRDVDAGPVIYKEFVRLSGTELVDEIRAALGDMTLDLCTRFLVEKHPPTGVAQQGEATFYRRRGPEDSRLDPQKTIAEQFDLLRVVDNSAYPAFFEYNGQRYILLISKDESKK